MAFPDDHEKLDLQSIKELASSINHYVNEFIANPNARKSLKSKFSSKLKIKKQDFFEFSEQSIVSNLYWGIENVEGAIQAKWMEEKELRLKNSEKMLQVPALLEEHGFTAGIPNHELVSCSYFYLSVVRKLQEDEWQVAMHFLQALVVSPVHVYKEFAPEFCENLFFRKDPFGRGSTKSGSILDLDEDGVSEAMREMARKCKAWLMYHEVMSCGETPQFQPDESQYMMNLKSSSTESSNSQEHGRCSNSYLKFEKVHPVNPQEHTNDEIELIMETINTGKFQNHENLEQNHGAYRTKRSNIKCLKDILKETQSDTPVSLDSCNYSSAEETLSEEYEDSECSLRTMRTDAEDQQTENIDKKQQFHGSQPKPARSVSMRLVPGDAIKKASEVNITKFLSGRLACSFPDSNLSIMEIKDVKSKPLRNRHMEEEQEAATLERFQPNDLQIVSKEGVTAKNLCEVCLHPEEDSHGEQVRLLEKIISKVSLSGPGKCEEDCSTEMTTVSEILNSRAGLKYSLLKDIILDQLLTAISTSKEEGVVRASVSILSTIVTGNKSAIEEIKKKGLQLSDLAGALKRNIHEAAILIYLINPSAAEIRTLELLPTLVDVLRNSNSCYTTPKSLPLTPPAASLMIIEVLVTAYDYETNNKHLATISSPRVIAKLLDVPRKDNLEEFISLAAILVRCMRFNGQCRKLISECTPLAPFFSLLRSKQKRSAFLALQFFHEVLCMPRASTICLLQQMRIEGITNDVGSLLLLVQKSEPEYKLLAANLFLQLDMMEDSSTEVQCREEAVNALLESVTCEENSLMQQLSAFIISNLGGTYAWTGEPNTVAWLVKKAGLTSLRDKNMIRNVDWSDKSLQDSATETWSSKIARRIIKFGNPVFRALEKGLRSKANRVSRDCLTAIAWLGREIVKASDDIRYSACEILLSTIEQYVHPGLELEERLLACLCIYNYASGKGMQKLVHFSEGVRESLRRLSNITWMAEELLKVANYLQPNKWRISCVHTQILEIGPSSGGAVTAIIYYKGQLYSGYTDGSIKVWDMKGQTATLVWDIKEHKKAVTCFSLFEPGNCLLSGSADKTIRIWQVDEGQLKQAEVIALKEPIQSLDTSGELIFVITHGRKTKVLDATRKAKDLFKNKRMKCVKVVDGKVYLGCMDSSIQELLIATGRQQEIKAPSKSWRMKTKPINAIAVYKDWLYSGNTVIEGSKIKDWRKNNKPQLSIVSEKGSNVLAIEVVEDFIYSNFSSTTSSLQIWLRDTQHKVGRLSAGSKITSLLTANDMVLCGTEAGLIKGWIPL